MKALIAVLFCIGLTSVVFVNFAEAEVIDQDFADEEGNWPLEPTEDNPDYTIEDEIWFDAQDPDFIINDDVTIAIDAGVVVWVDQGLVINDDVSIELGAGASIVTDNFPMTVSEGVSFELGDGATMIFEENLEVTGTAINPVTFSRLAVNDAWDQILFLGPDADVEFTFTNFTGGGSGGEGMIVLHNDESGQGNAEALTLTMTSCTIYDSESDGIHVISDIDDVNPWSRTTITLNAVTIGEALVDDDITNNGINYAEPENNSRSRNTLNMSNGCIIQECGGSGILSTNPGPNFFANYFDVLIDDCLIIKNDGHGIFLQHPDEGSVDGFDGEFQLTNGTIVSYNDMNGVVLGSDAAGSGTTIPVIIDDFCEFTYNDSNGVFLNDHTPSTLVEDCLFKSNLLNGLFINLEAHDDVQEVYTNEVLTNGHNGIFFQKGDDYGLPEIFINGNLVRDNGEDNQANDFSRANIKLRGGLSNDETGGVLPQLKLEFWDRNLRHFSQEKNDAQNAQKLH